MAEASQFLTRGFQEFSQEWLGLFQERLQKNIEGLVTFFAIDSGGSMIP